MYPHDNTWSIFAMKDITVEFVHVITGATYSTYRLCHIYGAFGTKYSS